ncbi:hypothetical protein CKA32_002381 [Geitlerinema sp. FC II]|nr:hypothetical protein CKA32_002381 [Geitlerinema sp. FC II]
MRSRSQRNPISIAAKPIDDRVCHRSRSSKFSLFRVTVDV